LRYAELEALGLVDNRGSLQNWIDAGAFPRALRIPGKYGKVLVWSAAEVAQLIARRFRERDEHPTEKETGNPEGRPSDSNNDPLAAGRTILRGRRGIYAPP
jgi:predicted DNA-binding transcriptional regulator AlpA